MNNLKLFYLTFLSSPLLFANCTYDLDLDFDFDNNQIAVSTNIKDTQKSIQLDIKDFSISNKSILEKKLRNGANKISFDYKKKIKNLDSRYIYLINNWYPKIDSLCTYSVKTNLNKSYKSIYEKTNKKIDNFNFISSKEFHIRIKKYNDITLKTYFLRNDEILVKKYFDKTIEYIRLYEKRIGKFPYKEFKIVENIYPTGYSMPTFTLIGSRLLDKEYILNQSLGHEILHQYFGNSVFNDFNKGNWIEGLTTYLSDDYYKKLKKDDKENRKVILNQYENFVNSKNEFPIKDFKYRYDKTSSMIGYSKLSFIFHMLENKIGEDKFNNLIKKLYTENESKKINLEDIATIFEKNTNIELSEFFSQWFNKKGQIDFKVENLKNYYNKDGFWLEFEVKQNQNNFFTFELPIKIDTYDKSFNKTILIKDSNQTIKLNFSSEILNLTIDKDINLFRKLSKNERFPAISSIMNEKDLIAIVNKNDLTKYNNIKKILPNAKILFSEDVKFKEIKDNSVIFLDFANDLLPQFYPKINIDKNNSFLEVKKHIYNDEKNIAILNIGKYKSRYFNMLKHFSQYSKIVLEKDKITKTIKETEDGIKMQLNTIPTISKIKKKPSIKNIYDEIKNDKIIYVGESHDNLEHHLNQLRVIKVLHQNKKDITIAMEMFQNPFQKDLDEYIQGITTLNEFLKKTEYYSRWKYDYNLYKPIIDYAKENKIPLIALNIDRKINQQVSKGSILSLNKKQKELIPKEIDQSNLEYKKSLEDIFKSHIPSHGKSKMDLDTFYQSQLIWDEVMADNIDKYMKKNPNKTVVVIAGSGHIENHRGIVSRVFRRNQLPFKVIINSPKNAKVGDIVISNKTKTELPKENKIGVALKNSADLTIIKVIENSIASKIKIKKNDKIIKINGNIVTSLSDLKRNLYFIEDINKVIITVERNKEIIDLKLYM